MGGEDALCSPPAPPVLEAPSCLPPLVSLASLLCPQDTCSLEGALEGVEPAWELSRLPPNPPTWVGLTPQWVGLTPSAPFPLLWSWRAPPTCLPCSLLDSLLRPQDQPGPERTSEGVGPGPRAGQTSLADWAGETLGLFPP